MADLVCLHALASSPTTWEPVRSGLTDLGYDVHCPQLLGHGTKRRDAYPLEAFRDDILAELDHLGLTDITLVGHSLGAVIASMVAAYAPSGVNRLVLEEMPVLRRNAEDTPPSRARGTAAALHVLGRLQRDYGPRLTREVLSALRRPHPE
jgi:esterase